MFSKICSGLSTGESSRNAVCFLMNPFNVFSHAHSSPAANFQQPDGVTQTGVDATSRQVQPRVHSSSRALQGAIMTWSSDPSIRTLANSSSTRNFQQPDDVAQTGADATSRQVQPRVRSSRRAPQEAMMTWSSDPARMTLANSSQLRQDGGQQFSVIKPVDFAELDDALDDDIRRPFASENHTRLDDTNVWTRGRTRSGSPIRSQTRPTRRDEPDMVEERSLPRPPVNVPWLSNVFRRLRSPSASTQQQLLTEQHAGTSVDASGTTIQPYLAALNSSAPAGASIRPNFILSQEDKQLLFNIDRRFAALGEACPKFRYKKSEEGNLVRILIYFAGWLNVKHEGSLVAYLRSQPVTDPSNIYNPTNVFSLFKNDDSFKLSSGYRSKIDRAVNKLKYLLEWEKGRQLSQITGYDSLFVENSAASDLASDARNIVSLRLKMSQPKEKDADILHALRNSRHCDTLLRIKFFIEKEFGVDESLSIIKSEIDREFTDALETLFKADGSMKPTYKKDFKPSIDILRGKKRSSIAKNYDRFLSEKDKKTSDNIYNYCKANGIGLGYNEDKIKSLKIFSRWLSGKGLYICLADVLTGIHSRGQVDALMDQYVVDEEVDWRFRSVIKEFVERIRGDKNLMDVLDNDVGAHNSANA
ncbi:unnamed protein product (plasmid) [Mycetohabitans rhizoxinica HKI 454]|uniref:Uncharacterized protein n=2 Tax=Burkholderiaceae TaxID=119060 RepID=E5AUS3_MYCRK|nr:unnamed protein product [Mycetohabitans rhizoxinica HKI 454]